MKSKVIWSSKSDEWETPQDLFDKLNEEFSFTLDPCATKENAKCKKFYTIEDDVLKQPWINENVFVNPPYSKIGMWIAKALLERNRGIIVMLLPARVDTKWFHNYLYDQRRWMPRFEIQIRLLRGRLKFGGATNSAPFPSMVVVIK